MMYIVNGSQFTNKRHIVQLRRRISIGSDSGSSEETMIDVFSDTFNIPIPLVAPEIRSSKRNGKATDLIIVNPKRRILLHCQI